MIRDYIAFNARRFKFSAHGAYFIEVALKVYSALIVGIAIKGVVKLVLDRHYYSNQEVTVTLGYLLVYLSVLGVIAFYALFASATWIRTNTLRTATSRRSVAFAMHRERIASSFGNIPVTTIFFPDVYDDALSVVRYSGDRPVLMEGDDASDVLAADNAWIIQRPHSALFENTRENVAAFNFPELEPVRESSSIIGRLWYGVQQSIHHHFTYVFSGELRDGLQWLLRPAFTVPVAYGQEADILCGKNIVDMVMAKDATPNRTAYVLYGVGRGALVALALLDHLRATQIRQIKGVVLEGLPTRQAVLANYTAEYRRKYPNEQVNDPFDRVLAWTTSPQHQLNFLIVTGSNDARIDFARTGHLVRHLQTTLGQSVNHLHLPGPSAGEYTTYKDEQTMAYERAALRFYQTLIV